MDGYQNINKPKADDYIDFSKKMITWTREIKWDIEKGKSYQLEKNSLRIALRRPFTKEVLYFNKGWNNMQYQIPKLVPNESLSNKLICINGIGSKKEFPSIITDKTPDLQVEFNGQCFPLYYYEEKETVQGSLFDGTGEGKYIRRDGLSDFILKKAIEQYGKSVTKEDIFYYVYGILHNPEYRDTFVNDLKKMLPRIPLIEKPKDFWAFSKAGSTLADLHINYEEVPPAKGIMVLYNTIPKEEIEKGLVGKDLEAVNYKVQKMAFAKKKEVIDGKNKTVADKNTIIYNSQITISEIPEKAYEYVSNGKSAIEWIMERYQVKTDKKSGIPNDPNDWAEEVDNPKYILDLLLSIIKCICAKQ